MTPPTADIKGQLAHARHELRTPVNAIIGYSEMLLEDAEGSAGAEFVERLQTVQAAGKRLQALITDLLGETKIEGRRLEELPPLVAEAAAQLRPVCQEALDRCLVLLQQTDQENLQNFRDDLNRISVAATRFLDLLPTVVSGQWPAVSKEAQTAADLSSPTADHSPLTTSSRGHILIVDDNEFNRDVLSRLLRRENYSFEQAGHGRQALEMLAAKPFDLVLLDIMMPEIDGFEVLRRIKADAALKHVPVIMISALDDIAGVVRCIEMGAEDYLPKPFDPVLLRARLGACLEKKRLRDHELDYLRNVAKVTEAAAGMEAGQFQLDPLLPVGTRTDALGQLARVFLSMAREVQAREQRLKTEVQQLKVEIDEARKASQVAEITETDFFADLQKKAQALRNRKK